MLKRHISEPILRAAERMPVLTITGPRQSGKTTLVRHLFPNHDYLSLERTDLRAQALEDPAGLLAGLGDHAILDEVQRTPDLLSFIQTLVDEEDRPGRFILTGSQNLLLMDAVSQTLAGRTAIFNLLPLSVAELTGRAALDPAGLDDPASSKSMDLKLWESLWAGFYPRIHDKRLDPDAWLADYVRTYVERDLRDVLRVMDLDGFSRFLRLAAARTGQELSYASLATDAGITQPTARSWMTALRVGFLAMLIPQHHQNYRKRLRKRPKLHFLDTGLCCYLLGIQNPKQLERHPLRGAIFESYVVSEIAKAFHNQGREAPLFHWRDATGHEVDLLLDLGNRLVPIEAKAGQTLPADAVDGLRWWTSLPGNQNRSGVVVYGGDRATQMHGMTIRPWWIA